MKKFQLCESDGKTGATIDYYKPFIKASDIAVVIFSGGAYVGLAEHEGEGYAQLLNTFGITAFVEIIGAIPIICFLRNCLMRVVQFVLCEQKRKSLQSIKTKCWR